MKIGWARADLTPDQPVLLTGQFHARVSEGVRDPVTATALALRSAGSGGQAADHAVMVSCDFVSIPDALRDAVRARLAGVEALEPLKVFLSATHTHTGPEVRIDRSGVGGGEFGVKLDAMAPKDYLEFAADRVAEAVRRAWQDAREGGVSFGLGQAVVGHNRRWTDRDGVSYMYGNTNSPGFSHIEGWEDHGVNLLFTWDRERRMTGVVVNLACPSQASENEFQVSADFWHETREEVRRRLGNGLYVLAQCSAAGDQSPHHIIRKAAELRMLELKGRTPRQEIAARIADAVEDVAQWMDKAIEWEPVLAHSVETVQLSRRALTEKDVEEALAEARTWRAKFEALREEIERRPELRERRRWYVDVTRARRRQQWYEAVATRWEEQKRQPRLPVEVHVVRLGDAAFATNPFEYYLDFGARIVARSRAVQTFPVQLAGAGTYVPTARSLAGGGYGAVPASTPVGPEGGAELAERTVEMINALWPPQQGSA